MGQGLFGRAKGMRPSAIKSSRFFLERGATAFSARRRPRQKDLTCIG